MTVRLATSSDREHIVGLLAAAFADDPAMSYIFPDPAPRRTRLFALLFDRDGKAGARTSSPKAAKRRRFGAVRAMLRP